jgi:CBS-domain-containing membrane protein
MNVTICMKRNVVSVREKTTIREATNIFVKKHIGLLPVLDDDEKPVGVIGMRDMLTLELPDFVNFLADVDFVHDFGAVEDIHPSAKTLNKTVKSLMKPAITVEEDCGLLRAYSLLVQHNQHDMPVVSKEGKLVGITSRVDIGAAILSTWLKADK